MAGRFSVEAVFKAVDRVTAPVSRMQTKVRKFTRAMSRGLRSADRAVSRLVGKMGKGAARVAKFGGAILAVGSAAAVTALNRTADAADELAKQSRRLQFPIEDLQEWKFVAEQSGVSTGLLDKSLGAFSKRLGEAKGGMGPLVTGLKKINPQLLKQLQGTDDVAKAFEIYIDAMRNADSATEKAALANAAFSRQGLKLVNIADNSSAAIAALRKEQNENGNITMAQAKAAEAYNDAANSLKRSLMGLLQQVILPMTPAITKTLSKWREWIVANKDLIRTRITEFMGNLWTRLKAVTRAVIEFNDKYDIAEMLGAGLDKLGKFASFVERNGEMIFKMVAAFVAASAALKVFSAIMAVVNLVMLANPITWIVLGIVALIAAIVAAVVYWDEIKAAMSSFAASVMSDVAPAIDWLKSGAEKVTGAWSVVSDFFAELWAGVTASFSDAWSMISGIVDKVMGAVNVVKNAAGKVSDFGSGVVDSTTGAVKNAASGVAGFFGFGDDEEKKQPSGGQSRPVVQSPQERTARSIEERRQTSSAEVTIRDESGRAEVTKGSMGAGVTLQPTGAF
jgi:hypothetical protein